MPEGSSTGKPQLRSVKDWICLVFYGMCMGAADIVPGISGGTLAFIMGFYENLICSIKSVDTHALTLLVRFRFRELFRRVAWEFLLALLTGISFSFITLAYFFNYLLGHETYRVFLYSAFIGLILASAIICARQIPKWQLKHLLTLAAGSMIAFVLTGTSLKLQLHEAHFHGIDWRLIGCGAIAVSAMLLPGISGSYLLTVLGVYSVVIEALADFIEGLKQHDFHSDAFFILVSVLIGIIIGALLFSRLISWLLQSYHSIAIASLTGFMLGALRSVWPYWSYAYQLSPLKLNKGPQLILVDPIVPSITSWLFWISIAFALLGFAFVFLIEYAARKRSLIIDLV